MSGVSKKMLQAAAGASEAPIEAVAYVGLQDTDKILSVDITDPSNMSIISEVSLNAPSDFALDAARNVLFVASTVNKRVYAYDISDPAQMTLLRSVVVTTNVDNRALSYDPVNQRVLTATRTILDVSNPSTMSVLVSGTADTRSVRYVRQATFPAGAGLFGAGLTNNNLAVLSVTSSSVGTEGQVSLNVSSRPDALASDETNNLLFAAGGGPRVYAISDTGGISQESSGSFVDGVFSVATSPTDLRAYAFVETSNGSRRLATFSYNANGSGLTFITQTGSFGIQTQVANGLHVNRDRGVLGMTKSNVTTGASDLSIYGLANPSAPAFQGSISLAASGENFSFVKIQNYPTE